MEFIDYVILAPAVISGTTACLFWIIPFIGIVYAVFYHGPKVFLENKKRMINIFLNNKIWEYGCIWFIIFLISMVAPIALYGKK